MKNFIRVAVVSVVSMLLLTVIAWANGNENYYRHEVEKVISPSSIGKEPDSDREYFYETIVIENVKASSSFMQFDSYYDTLSSNLMSRKVGG